MLQKDNFHVKDLYVSILLPSAVLLRKYNPGMNGQLYVIGFQKMCANYKFCHLCNVTMYMAIIVICNSVERRKGISEQSY